jgi:sec-independent protein translocase protein TatC
VEATVKEPAKETPDEVRMTFGEHLEELRSRLIKCVVMLAFTCITCCALYESLLRFIVKPHYEAMRLLGRTVAESHLMSGGYTAPIWAVMKLGFILGTFIASPWLGYQIWAFVSAGLYRHEKKWVKVFAPFSLLLFALGCVFGYLILIPYGLYGMAAMMSLDVVSPQYLLRDYLDLVMTLTLATGAIFELPLVMTFTTAVGLTTARWWLKQTRIAIVVIFIAAAVLTPSPDIYTQLLMAAPLFLLYFVGMGLSAFIRPRKRVLDEKAPQP